MKLKYFQKGFNFSQDGPGNRLVIHLQGCNLKCPWCANPEGLNPNGVLMTTDKTNGSFCPKGAFADGVLNRELCRGCSMPCTGIPASGLKLSCTEEEVSDIVAYCVTCKMMFFDGGGVTISGGEPTVQFDALKELLSELKAEGIHTAVECNGTHPDLPDLFPLIDYLIMDCKHYDSAKHKSVCGLPNDNILQNIKAACASRNQLLVRIPLIGGFNASLQDAAQFAALFREIGNENVQYEFLRYHEFGKNKYENCGYSYTMTEEAKVPPERIREFSDIFHQNGLKTLHT